MADSMTDVPARESQVGRAAFVLVVTAGWTINLTFTLIAPILPFIAAQSGGTHSGELAAELVMTVASLGVMLGMLSSGAVQERLGLRTTILLSALCTAAAGSSGFYLQNLWLLGVSRAFLGFFGASSTAAATVLLANLFAEKDRGRILGYQQAVAGAFNVCGSLLGGFIGTLLGWRYVFLVYGLFGLMSFVLGLGATAGISVSARRLQGSLPQAIAGSWPLLAAGIGVMTLTIVPFTQGSFLLEGAGVNDPRALAVMISCSASLLILGASLYSRFRSRTGGPVIILIGAILASLGVIVMGTSSLAWIIAVGIGMTGFAGGLVITALLHEATEGEAHLRPRAIGLVHACLFLGVFLNPVIIGFLHAHFALDQAVAAWGAAGFTGAILAALVWRMRSRRAS